MVLFCEAVYDLTIELQIISLALEGLRRMALKRIVSLDRSQQRRYTLQSTIGCGS